MKAHFTETEHVFLYMDTEKAKTYLMELYIVCNKKVLKFPDLGIYQIIFNMLQMLQLILIPPKLYLLVFFQLQLIWIPIYIFSNTCFWW